MHNAPLKTLLIMALLFIGGLYAAIKIPGCTDQSCSVPDFVQNNLSRFEQLAMQMLNAPDSLELRLASGYKYNVGVRQYNLLPESQRDTVNMDKLVQEMLQLNVIRFYIWDGNAYFHYSYQSNSVIGEIIYRYLIFENYPVQLENTEGDMTWNVLCDKKLSNKIRHVVVLEEN